MSETAGQPFGAAYDTVRGVWTYPAPEDNSEAGEAGMSETTETGPVLGERRRPRFEVRKAPETKAIRDAMRRHHHGEGNSCDWCTEVAVRLVEEVVDPLVAEAERRGEARGAQAERERIRNVALSADALSRADIWSGQLPIRDLQTFVRQLLDGAS